MTPDDIARLRALLQAATSQPWRTANGTRSASVVTDGPERCAIYVNADRYGGMVCSVPRWQADATLIAAAVNALGPLLDEVERLRRENDEHKRMREVLGTLAHQHHGVRDRLRDEVIALERKVADLEFKLKSIELPQLTDDDIAAVIAASGED